VSRMSVRQSFSHVPIVEHPLHIQELAHTLVAPFKNLVVHFLPARLFSFLILSN